jgi:hypothetical protein
VSRPVRPGVAPAPAPAAQPTPAAPEVTPVIPGEDELASVEQARHEAAGEAAPDQRASGSVTPRMTPRVSRPQAQRSPVESGGAASAAVPVSAAEDEGSGALLGVLILVLLGLLLCVLLAVIASGNG